LTNRVVREQMRALSMRQNEKARGVPTGPQRFASHRQMDINIPVVSKLPVYPEDGPLQDGDGNFYLLDGYSDPDGPDI
jgi:hypothetical protein